MNKLVIKNRTHLRGFSVLNEYGNTIYDIKKKNIISTSYIIYDKNRIIVGRVLREHLSLMPCYKLIIDEEEIVKVRRTFSVYSSIYKIIKMDINLFGDMLGHNFIANTLDGERILRIEQRQGWGSVYDIDILKQIENIELISLTFAICIYRTNRYLKK
ncbi:MAG: hypothetical protein ACK5HP_04665 [Bacilli bacterium]